MTKEEIIRKKSNYLIRQKLSPEYNLSNYSETPFAPGIEGFLVFIQQQLFGDGLQLQYGHYP